MTYTQAIKYLKHAMNSGYVRYHSGLVKSEVEKSWGGNTSGYEYGINIDGDGHNGRLFGCPQIIWAVEQAEIMFPTRGYNRKR